MTTHYHTPLSGPNNVDAITFNTIFSSLDAAIYANAQAIANQLTAEAGEGVADRDAGYINLSDGKAYLLDADAVPADASVIRGFFDGTTIIAGTATLQISGIMDGFTGLTALEPVYVDTTSGAITQTRPVPSSGGSQVAIIEMGFAITTTTVFIAPKPIQYQKRDAMAQNDTLTVQHHSDPNGYKRRVAAYITEAIAGAVIEEYTNTNQDSQVGLEDKSVATYGSDQCSGGTPSASSAVQPASNAFDDSNATDWRSSTDADEWIEYNFGASKTIRRYTITSRNTAQTNDPDAWRLEYYNGSTWETADTQTGQSGWSTSEKRTFDVSTPYSAARWRLYFTANEGGSQVNVAEIEMMEAATFSDGADKLSQSFTIASAEDIGAVTLYLRKVGSPTGTLTIRIETDNSGDPSGTLADANASQTFAESSLSDSFTDETITFPAEFNLSSGTYHIVIDTDRAASETDYVDWGADSSAPSYAGGEGKSYDGATWSAESVDFIFGVYEPGTIRPAQISVDWWSSTHADMVNRYDDGAGANLETQTTFKCTRSSGFDDVTVIVEIQ